jgi:hypothetical protein
MKHAPLHKPFRHACSGRGGRFKVICVCPVLLFPDIQSGTLNFRVGSEAAVSHSGPKGSFSVQTRQAHECQKCPVFPNEDISNRRFYDRVAAQDITRKRKRLQKKSSLVTMRPISYLWAPLRTGFIAVGASLLANAVHEKQQLRGQARSCNCIDSSFSRSPYVYSFHSQPSPPFHHPEVLCSSISWNLS